jgi:hypothetical protein
MSESNKINELEKQIRFLTQQVSNLNKRVDFLERENKRRRSEIQQQKK